MVLQIRRSFQSTRSKETWMTKFFSGMDPISIIVASLLGLIVLVVLVVCGLLSLQAKERERQRLADEAYARRRASQEANAEYDYRGVRKAPLQSRNLTGVPDTFLTQEEREELARRRAKLAVAE